MGSGKTRPSLMICSNEHEIEIEAIVKLRAGCEMGYRSLVAEAVIGMLAADLDLPVPEPLLVYLDASFVENISDTTIRDLAKRSMGWNFGSRKLPPGYYSVLPERPAPAELLATAAEILAFDTFLANPDRRRCNPNCLTNSRQYAIIDHELALFTQGIIGWKAPWVASSIRLFTQPTPDQHIFAETFRGRTLELKRFIGAFNAITKARLEEYHRALPREWLAENDIAPAMLSYRYDLKVNLAEAIAQLRDALR